MESVTVSRTLRASPEAVREAMADVGPFMEAAGFDEVEVQGDGETVRVANRVGIADIELTLALVGDLLDSTVIRRQRRKELAAQFDWLETATTGGDGRPR